MSISRKELLEFTNKFADKSGSILQKNYLKNFDIQKKLDGSFVTNIDKEIESLFRKLLKKSYPSHGVLGEEFGGQNLDAEYLWIIDPLDGTHSFISGKPLFGTLISCTKENVPFIGLIDIPIMKQRWIGGIGAGVFFNGRKCQNIKIKNSLKDSIVSSTSTLMFDTKDSLKVKEIYQKTRFPIFGTDCYAYGLLLLGKIDLIVEANLKPWDFMAQIPLIKELGGNISDWKGKKLDIDSDGKVIASMNNNHHKKLINFLK